jgi:hypothetical protein
MIFEMRKPTVKLSRCKRNHLNVEFIICAEFSILPKSKYGKRDKGSTLKQRPLTIKGKTIKGIKIEI